MEALPDGQKPDPRYDPQRKAAGGQFPPNDLPNRPRDKSVSNNPNDPNNQTNDPGGEKVTGGDVSTNNNGEDGGNKTTEEPGTKTSEEPGTKAPEEPGTKTTEEAGTKTIEEPATKTSEEPGTKTPEEPGTKTTEEPGTKTSEQPSTKTNEEPGTKTPEERGTKTTEEPGTKISEEPVTKNTEDAGAKTTDELGTRSPEEPGTKNAGEPATPSGGEPAKPNSTPSKAVTNEPTPSGELATASGPSASNPEVPEPAANAAIAAATLAACLKSGRSYSECAVEAGINVAAVPPDMGSKLGNTAAGGAVAGELAFFTCLAAGSSALQCMGEAIKAGAQGTFCAAIGTMDPVLGGGGSLIAAGTEGYGAVLAQLEADAAIDAQIKQAEKNFNDKAALVRRIAGLEAKIKQFESDAGPVLDGCIALNRLVTQAQQAPATSACGAATPVSSATASRSAVVDLVTRAREAATRARQLVSKFEADRTRLNAEIIDFSYAFPQDAMRLLVTDWQGRLQFPNCSLADIDQAQAAIDKAASAALKPGQTAAACPNGSQAGSPPPEKCSIYSLDLSGPSIWVGTELERLQPRVYIDGSNDAQVANVLGVLGTYPDCEAATKAWCQMFKNASDASDVWKTMKKIGGKAYQYPNAPSCDDVPQDQVHADIASNAPEYGASAPNAPVHEPTSKQASIPPPPENPRLTHPPDQPSPVPGPTANGGTPAEPIPPHNLPSGPTMPNKPIIDTWTRTPGPTVPNKPIIDTWTPPKQPPNKGGPGINGGYFLPGGITCLGDVGHASCTDTGGHPVSCTADNICTDSAGRVVSQPPPIKPPQPPTTTATKPQPSPGQAAPPPLGPQAGNSPSPAAPSNPGPKANGPTVTPLPPPTVNAQPKVSLLQPTPATQPKPLPAPSVTSPPKIQPGSTVVAPANPKPLPPPAIAAQPKLQPGLAVVALAQPKPLPPPAIAAQPKLQPALPAVAAITPPVPPSGEEKLHEPQPPPAGAAKLHEPKVPQAGVPKVHEPKVATLPPEEAPAQRAPGQVYRPPVRHAAPRGVPSHHGSTAGIDALGAIGGAILQGLRHGHSSGGGGGMPQHHHH